ncbi:MAG TPA: hypothetical protein VFY48_10760 [Solirubrobacterales bacterium]|nr:hypothetical protein [Solirubrobacterales bacterium]
MEVQVARDYLDYLQAFGGLASLVIALVAAWFAWRSASSSEESAEAAERTAEAAEVTADAAKRETDLLVAEHERVPDVAVSLYIENMSTEPSGEVHVWVKLEAYNTGDRVAEGAFCALFAPRAVELRDCAPNGDLRVADTPVPQSSEKLNIDGETADTHSLNLRKDLLPHIAELRHVRMTFHKPGRYQILGGVRHPDIPNGEVRIIEEILIPKVESEPPALTEPEPGTGDSASV